MWFLLFSYYKYAMRSGFAGSLGLAFSIFLNMSQCSPLPSHKFHIIHRVCEFSFPQDLPTLHIVKHFKFCLSEHVVRWFSAILVSFSVNSLFICLVHYSTILLFSYWSQILNIHLFSLIFLFEISYSNFYGVFPTQMS